MNGLASVLVRQMSAEMHEVRVLLPLPTGARFRRRAARTYIHVDS